MSISKRLGKKYKAIILKTESAAKKTKSNAKTNTMTVVYAHTSIITLNNNDVKSPTKRYELTGSRNKILLFVASKKDFLALKKDTT